MHELRSHRFFDVFEYNGPRQHWGCFLCNHPDKATYFVEEQEPVIEGQLKEKRGGRWKLFKKWKSRYFTLSGDKLTYKDTVIRSHVNSLYIMINDIIHNRRSNRRLFVFLLHVLGLFSAVSVYLCTGRAY